MIKGIVFDKDGTLLDYESFWVPVAEGAVRRLLDTAGLSDRLADALDAIGTYDGIKGVLCHGTYGDIANALNAALGEASFTRDEVAAAFAECVGLAKIRPTCPNIRRVFEELHASTLTVAVVTSDNQALTEHCLSELGIADLLDRVYTDDGVHPSKPDPYYMELFLREYGFSPSEVLMVGDTLTDMVFAENSGVFGVGVGKYALELLASRAAHIIPDISQILTVTEEHNND